MVNTGSTFCSEYLSTRDMPSLYPHAKGILYALKDKGVDIAVASRSPTPDIANTFLEKSGIKSIFVAQVSWLSSFLSLDWGSEIKFLCWSILRTHLCLRLSYAKFAILLLLFEQFHLIVNFESLKPHPFHSNLLLKSKPFNTNARKSIYLQCCLVSFL